MIEAEYRERMKIRLESLGLEYSDDIIENKVQECKERSVCYGVPAAEAFEEDIEKWQGDADAWGDSE